eukprot:CAMPEP_0175827654 /NCGR_PEP_ID=MMETSP0107_2-20121207/12398_1 /TAXON_ID=195067 ORGANISM="Goniomonas pacifica, Strain CCMP1869" /NCGR_SAMPLE_ID=MMETSP0107_2 /ASSEMBLY_ACC=CAM_ASM_000203 /LENGTH=58 /DNA_ID=CAMNT_0017140343 /DNA_START=44 /DNA_END=220 /DNA_ORIENTATION=-
MPSCPNFWDKQSLSEGWWHGKGAADRSDKAFKTKMWQSFNDGVDQTSNTYFKSNQNPY